MPGKGDAFVKKEKAQKGGSWKVVLTTILCILLALVLAIVAVGSAFANYLLSKIDRVQMGQEPTISPSQVEDMLNTDPDLTPVDPSESLPDIGDITFPSEDPEPVGQGGHVINILLIGQDTESGAVRARSDSMILMTLNTKAGTVTFTSFMRDAYVQIPGYKPNKLNHAYQYGGMKLLNETLKVNFGVEVDGDVEVNFAQFESIIDLLGGVDIDLTEEEAAYMCLGPGKEWDLKPGVNRLNGEQALSYARIREIDSDYHRTLRQRTLLTALTNAYKNQPIDQLLPLLEEILGLITTNMTDAQIWDCAFNLIPMLSGLQVRSDRIPADGTFRQGSVQVRPGLKGWFQYDIDFEANRQRLQRIMDEE